MPHGSGGWSLPPWALVTRALWEVAALQPMSSVCRGLLQVALRRKGQAPEEDEDPEAR